MQDSGLDVLRVGRKTAITPSAMARQCQVVVISVPISDTLAMIRELGPLVREDGLLMDLTSLKKGPVDAMLRYSRAQVVGIHPLFGPSGETHPGLRAALCPGRGEEGLRWIKDVLTKQGVEVTVIDPEKHDRMMALIQAVNHFDTLALAHCISRSGFELQDLANTSTQTFQKRMDRIKEMLAQPSELFGSLLMDNPWAAESIGQYLNSVELLLRMTRDRDREGFERLFGSLGAVFLSGGEPS
jgi:prephenate dehydrogenase